MPMHASTKSLALLLYNFCFVLFWLAIFFYNFFFFLVFCFVFLSLTLLIPIYSRARTSCPSLSFSLVRLFFGCGEPRILNTIEVMATNHIKYKFLFMAIGKTQAKRSMDKG